MAEISKIKLPSGTTYTIKDATARQMASGAIILRGSTTTALTDEATTNPIKINNADFNAASGDAVFYNKKEYIFDGTKWHEFGDMSGLGTLATKDSVTLSVKTNTTGTFVPTGTVSKPTFGGTAGTVSVTGKTTGTITTSSTVADDTLDIKPYGDISTPTFTGTEGSVSVSGTTGGSITGSSSTTSTGATFQIKGTISKPNVTVTATPVTKYVAASATGGGSATAGTAASWTASVSNEVLTIGWTANTPTKVTMPSFTSQDIVPSVTAKLAANPALTGEYVKLTFTGAAVTSTGTFTPSGEVSTPTFTGKQKLIRFSGANMTSTGTFTPSGEVSQPSFTATNSASITVS